MNSFDSLNSYLESQNPKQRIYLYIAIVVLVFILGYILFLSELTTELEDKDAQIERKKIELSKLKRNSGVKKIKILNKQIDKMKSTLQTKSRQAAQDELYVDDKPNLDINDGSFAQFLEKSLSFSKSVHVRVDNMEIKSQKLPYIGLLEIKKNLLVQGNGRFLDILTLLRYMENQQFLIKLKYLSIDKPKLPKKDDKKFKKFKRENVDFEVLFEILGAS